MRIRQHIGNVDEEKTMEKIREKAINEEKIKLISHEDNNKYHDFLLAFSLFKDY